ncbi:MAG: carbohydrate-binding protein [Verrucomicrobiota bacterium]
MGVLLGVLTTQFTLANTATFTVPSSVTNDGDSNPTAPWESTGNTTLTLAFDTSGLIPAGSQIQNATLQLQGATTGSIFGGSFRAEINVRLVAPNGSSQRWDAGEDFGFLNSGGSFDTGIVSSSVSGEASGTFRIELTEDYDDADNDCRFSAAYLTVTYEGGSSSNIFATPIGSYLNGNFPDEDPESSGIEPPAFLSQTGAFTDLANLTPAPGLLPYSVNSPLWSDNALKQRWIALPNDGNRDSSNEQIAFNAESPWTFPAGTVAIKHFELGTNDNNPSQTRRLETRFLVSLGNNEFYGVTYRWFPDGSDAELLTDSASDTITITNSNGSTRNQTWDYPSRPDCRSCHNQGAGIYLGLNTWQLNGDHTYPGDSSPSNQLETWNNNNLFTSIINSPNNYARAVNLGDSSASLENRVRSYLASNCANCHNPESDLSTNFDLRFNTSLSDTNLIDGSVLYDLGINDAVIVAPQDVDRSLLHYRMDTTGIHRMPPIGRNLIDQNAVDTVRDWINSLSTGNQGGNNNAPIANDDDALTQGDTPVVIPALSNDSDEDGDSFMRYQSTSPSNGSVSWTGGSATYTADPGFSGTDQFTYQIADSNNAVSNVATVTITVTNFNTSNDISFSDQSSLLPNPSTYSGVAMGVADMNQDGYDDIVRILNARNLHIDYQQPDGSNFTTRSLGTVSNQGQWGLAIGDADNNGFPDLISGGYYDGLHYYQANNNATAYSKTTINNPTIFAQAITFADINQDGWLDVFACHDDAESLKLRNDRSGNLISDLSMMDTRTTQPSDNSGNYGAVWTDYDSDGDLDLYVSKCRIGASSSSDPRRINQLFENDGNGNYYEVADQAGLADGEQSWVADFADFDNDGDLDCFIGNHTGSSRLMRNNGNRTFTEVTGESGISVTWKVIQSVFRDFNNDGWIDLFLTGTTHELWLNDRDGTFTKADNPFTGSLIESCAIGDLNRDGFPDVYAGYARLYNTPQSSRTDKLFLSNPNGNNFLSISLTGTNSNRLASGARLELYGPWGVQIREVRSGEGYGISHSFTQTFGLGTLSEADHLIIRWPSGTTDNFYNLGANQFLNIVEGSGENGPNPDPDPDPNPDPNPNPNPGNNLAYNGNPADIPGRIEAENFDTGGANTSFYDLDSNNIGGDYRNTGVDLEPSQDEDGTSSLGWAEDGEWIQYTVNLTSGTYDLIARAASEFSSPGALRILLDGNELGTIDISSTGGWYNWQNFTLSNIEINNSGTATLRIEIIGASFNLNWLEFTSPSGNNGNDNNNNGGGNDNGQTAFTSAFIPGRIEAENFDNGGQGTAYSDLDPENIGEQYRDSSVDLERSFDSEDGYSIGWIEDSEWVEYTVDVTPGNYDLTARIASAESNPGSIRILLDNRELGTLSVQGTGDWYSWEETTLSNTSITESGSAKLRLEFIGGPYNLNWIQFGDSTTGGNNNGNNNGQSPYNGSPANLPGRVQAEDYDFGGQGIAYQDNEEQNITGEYRNDGVDIENSGDSDGTFSLGWFDANEWTEYTVNIDSGSYNLSVRTAAGESNPGALRILLNDTELATIDTPDTGGPSNWQTSTVTVFVPNSGTQILRVETVGNGTNFNWLEFSSAFVQNQFQINSAVESVSDYAFGSWNGITGEGQQPFFSWTASENQTYPSVSFLVRLGGSLSQHGYVRDDLIYRPICSTDLNDWDDQLIFINNPLNLPVPPAGFKYLTFRCTQQADRAFFRVNLQER